MQCTVCAAERRARKDWRQSRARGPRGPRQALCEPTPFIAIHRLACDHLGRLLQHRPEQRPGQRQQRAQQPHQPARRGRGQAEHERRLACQHAHELLGVWHHVRRTRRPTKRIHKLLYLPFKPGQQGRPGADVKRRGRRQQWRRRSSLCWQRRRAARVPAGDGRARVRDGGSCCRAAAGGAPGGAAAAWLRRGGGVGGAVGRGAGGPRRRRPGAGRRAPCCCAAEGAPAAAGLLQVVVRDGVQLRHLLEVARRVAPLGAPPGPGGLLDAVAGPAALASSPGRRCRPRVGYLLRSRPQRHAVLARRPLVMPLLRLLPLLPFKVQPPLLLRLLRLVLLGH